ncbi:hypothetical protein [Comamonas antarctica]|uniref:hypothetical protein n=1 Tax=Comamonas antarctica TaxID=2743470 RepID=UPI0028E6110A|nr:hypothetical protein [Comamonas antarctica]
MNTLQGKNFSVGGKFARTMYRAHVDCVMLCKVVPSCGAVVKPFFTARGVRKPCMVCTASYQFHINQRGAGHHRADAQAVGMRFCCMSKGWECSRT